MYFLPLNWDGGVGVERMSRGLVQTLDFSIIEDFCHSSFFSAMVHGVADMCRLHQLCVAG